MLGLKLNHVSKRGPRSLGNLQKIGEFPSQMSSNMERVSMSWHHHGNHMFHHFCPFASPSATNYPDSKIHGGQHGGPAGAGRTQVGPMLAPWTLLSGYLIIIRYELCPVTANRLFAHIPQYTILKQIYAHVWISFLQNGAIWDICLMHCGISQ